MRTFKDMRDREWTLQVTNHQVRRLKAKLDFDPRELVDPRVLQPFMDDPLRIGDVLYCCIEPEAQKRGVSLEDFDAAMAGDPLGTALQVFLDELADFFLDPRKRAAFQRVVKATAVVMDRAMQVIETKLGDENLDATIQQAMDQALIEAGLSPSANASPGDVPASAASTPAGSPSAS